MKDLICIVCPRGCELKIEDSDGEPEVYGCFCSRGRDFALTEISSPERVVCSTVKTVFPGVPVLPVRVSSEIPKEKIFDLMKLINSHVVDKPLGCGDVVIADVLGLGVDLIATSGILKTE